MKFLHRTTSYVFCIPHTTETVPEIFLNLNVVAHSVLLVGWGLSLLRLATFVIVNV